MKKIYTIILSLCFVLAAYAGNTSAQENENAFSFNFLVAYNLEGTGNLISGDDPVSVKKGDFCFELLQRDEEDNETIVAQIYASTATRTLEHLTGAYGIGAIGTFSYLFEGEERLRCPSGSMYIECVGDTSIELVEGKPAVKMPLYRIRLIDVLTTTGRTINIEGARIPAMCINKKEYDEMQQTNETNDGWFYFPQDKPYDAIEIETAVYDYKDYTASQGAWLVQGLNLELSNYEVVLVVSSRSLTGASPSVLTVGQNNAPLTCVYEYGEDFSEVTTINIASGYGVVWETDTARNYDFYLISTDNQVYHVRMLSYYLMALDSQINIDKTYTSASITKENFTVGVTARDETSAVNMFFYVGSHGGDVLLPDGTYTISYDHQPGTVRASRGIEYASYSLDPSFYTTFDAEGMADEIAFLVSGTVVVTNSDGAINIAVDARNSLEKQVKINISAATTALPAVFGTDDYKDVEKRIGEDGQIVIIRGGKTYNLQGMQLR